MAPKKESMPIQKKKITNPQKTRVLVSINKAKYDRLRKIGMEHGLSSGFVSQLFDIAVDLGLKAIKDKMNPVVTLSYLERSFNSPEQLDLFSFCYKNEKDCVPKSPNVLERKKKKKGKD